MPDVSAFLWQAALMLLAAYFLGAFIGCWLRRQFTAPPKVAMEADAGTNTAAQTVTAAGAAAAAATAAVATTAAAKTESSSDNAPSTLEADLPGAMGDAAARSASAEAPAEPQTSAPAEAAATQAPPDTETAPASAAAESKPQQFTPPMSAAAAAAAALAARQAAMAAEPKPDPAAAPEPAPPGPSPTAAKLETIAPPVKIRPSDLPTASGSSGQAVVAAQVASTVAAPAVTDDDLTLIAGISPEDAQKISGAGFSTFAAIAALTAGDVSKLNDLIGGRRVSRENWIEQAQLLQAGTNTTFSQRAHPELAPRPPAVTGAPPAKASPATTAPTAAPISAVASASAAAAAIASTVQSEDIATTRPGVSDRAAFSRERRGYADDLQQIDGVNAEVEKLLNEQGVTRISQIAGWPLEEQKRIDRLLGGMDRVKRERWVEQARRLSGFADPAPEPISAPAVSAQSTEVPATEPQQPIASTPVAEPPSAPKTTADASPANVSQLGATPASSGSVRGLKSVRSEALVGPNTVTNTGVNNDLKYIRGIGVLIEKRLRAMGYTSYAQIASWTQSDVDRVNQQLDFRGRIERENWIEQARILAAGGQTDFSRRQDRGDD